MKWQAGLVFATSTLLLHGVLLCALEESSARFEVPRLGPATISVRLQPAPVAAAKPAGGLPAPATAATRNPTQLAEGQPASQEQRATQPDDWLPSGKLTRLPMPLDALDLEEEGAVASGWSGRLELVLLVDREGRVQKVSTRNREPGAQEFAQRVEQRFRNTRFSPGEIDGQPVNAVLKIAVVSERAPPDPH